jgi:putative addiction module CopG family antidote
MSKTYNPGPEADAIIERQLAKGTYGTADEVVRAGVRVLEEQEAELEELRTMKVTPQLLLAKCTATPTPPS